jgi:hypothetical protein
MKNIIYACIVLAICRLMALYVFYTFDDAYITYRYSRNLAEGFGLVYNTHEKVLGTTAPLFALIGAIPAWLSISIPKFLALFNILCDLGSLYLISRFILDGNKVLIILFTLFFALNPSTSRIAVGGMEANLFLFCSLTGMVLYFNRKKTLAFLLLAIIYFLRPEALILFTILIFYEWFDTKTFPIKNLVICLLLMGQYCLLYICTTDIGFHNLLLRKVIFLDLTLSILSGTYSFRIYSIIFFSHWQYLASSGSSGRQDIL